MAGATFSVTAEGIVEIHRDFGSVAAHVQPTAAAILGAYAQKIRSDAINSIRKSTPMGRVYSIKGKRKNAIEHRASAPGQPPAVVTGRLWGSITAESRNGGMVQEIGPTVNYGKYLETGTKRMDARPYMEPALQRNIGGLDRALADAIAKKLQGP